MSENVVRGYVVKYKTVEGYRYAFDVVEVYGEYVTEEVSAGQHSYDHTDFRTVGGGTYASYEVYESEASAFTQGRAGVARCAERLRNVMSHFDPRDLGSIAPEPGALA